MDRRGSTINAILNPERDGNAANDVQGTGSLVLGLYRPLGQQEPARKVMHQSRDSGLGFVFGRKSASQW